jgi:molybdopterin converting factor small subunit
MENIVLNVLFFGSLKTYFGNRQQLQVPMGLKLDAFINMLKEQSPAASGILVSCQVAVDNELQREDFSLQQPSEIAILPPFSGG